MQRAGVNIDLCAEIEEVSLQCTAPEVTLSNRYDETDGHFSVAVATENVVCLGQDSNLCLLACKLSTTPQTCWLQTLEVVVLLARVPVPVCVPHSEKR